MRPNSAKILHHCGRSSLQWNWCAHWCAQSEARNRDSCVWASIWFSIIECFTKEGLHFNCYKREQQGSDHSIFPDCMGRRDALTYLFRCHDCWTGTHPRCWPFPLLVALPSPTIARHIFFLQISLETQHKPRHHTSAVVHSQRERNGGRQRKGEEGLCRAARTFRKPVLRTLCGYFITLRWKRRPLFRKIKMTHRISGFNLFSQNSEFWGLLG